MEITGDAGGRPEGSGPSAEELALSADTVRMVREKILSLEAPYREPAALFLLGGLTPDEIARELGRPLKTVRTQLYRAKQKLQKLIGEEMRE